MAAPRVVIVMGVAGSGKSTVGVRLSRALGAAYFDADAFHSHESVAKMESGIPLDDADRAPWLARMREVVVDGTPAYERCVLACSALKKAYRDALGVARDDVALVYLDGSPELLASRLQARLGHFMKPEMLASQLATLEKPDADEGITVSIDQPVEAIVAEIVRALA